MLLQTGRFHISSSVCVYIPFIIFVFIYPSKDTSCFHVLAIVNNAAKNIKLQLSLRDMYFISSPRNVIAETYGSFFISYNSLCFNVYLSGVCIATPGFLFCFIFMKYVLPSFYVQSVCTF